eukprot:TRINITY_DN4886_c0_g1_i2.p1 TRINITY_DN4886_c0_g1~~TRINITY_DN4886_c0_g1_i2.p1  ORF type:complete len:594 (+),score=165.07 TRINITY_DN4886_c0_g1_i2:31-1782(+)
MASDPCVFDKILRKETPATAETEAPPFDEEEWSDVTTLLEEASVEMKEGEMLHTKLFTLRDSMSATEIMDPKMDTGLGAAFVNTYEEHVAAGTMPDTSKFSLPQVLAIMDRLLQCEAAWYDGHPLVYTLYTCYSVHQPKEIANPWLRDYVISLLKTADNVRNIVASAQINEEEDFCTGLSGFGELNVAVTWDELNAALSVADKQLSAAVKCMTPVAGCEDAQIISAVLARLQFRKALITLYNGLKKRNVTILKKAAEEAQQKLELVKQSCTELVKCDVPPYTFEPKIARRLLMPTSVRQITLPSLADALEAISLQIANIVKACNIPINVNMQGMMNYTTQFMETHPCIVSRSWLFCILTWGEKAFGKKLEQLCADAMISMPIPPAKVHDPSAKRFVEDFTKHWVHALQVLCLNAARQQRRLPEVVRKLEYMQGEAHQLDTQLTANSPIHKLAPEAHGDCKCADSNAHKPRPPQYFLNFVSHVKYLLLVRYLQLGFINNVYEPPEFQMIAWYIDYVTAVHITQYAEYKMRYLQEHELEAAARKGVPEKKATKKATEVAKAAPHTALQIFLDAQQNTIRGVFRVS